MSATLQINTALLDQFDKELAGLKLLARMPAIKDGMKAAGKPVENHIRATLPLPGYWGDKPGFKALRDTVATKVLEYLSGVVVAIVGYRWGAGSHGHNVEEGHDIVVGGTSADPGTDRKSPRKSKVEGKTGMGAVRGRVEGRFDIANAAKATESQQSAAISASVAVAIEQAKRG